MPSELGLARLMTIFAICTATMKPVCGSATDWFVDPNGPLTIQEAIDGASDGDTVVRRVGIHPADSTVTLRNGISLVSENGNAVGTWLVPAVDRGRSDFPDGATHSSVRPGTSRSAPRPHDSCSVTRPSSQRTRIFPFPSPISP